MEMILNGGKEKFTINSKDLGVAKNTKLILKDFAFHKTNMMKVVQQA
jgi:excinuclease ABC subunit A